MKTYRNLNLSEEEIEKSEELIRLAKERLKKKREKEREVEEENEEKIKDQTGANIILICFLGIVAYKIMTGTF